MKFQESGVRGKKIGRDRTLGRREEPTPGRGVSLKKKDLKARITKEVIRSPTKGGGKKPKP